MPLSDRPEDLLAHRGRVGVDAGEDRGLDEEAAALGVGAAAADHGGALALGGVEDPGHLLELRRVGQRPHLGVGIDRVAEHDRAGALGDPLDQLVVDVLVHDQARAGHARLPGGREHAGDDAVGRRLEVRVGEHDLRRLAAELERHAREVAGGAGGDVDAGLRRARERDLVHARMAHERAPDVRPVAGDDVEHAGGEARLRHELGELERGHGRVVARLGHDRAAGRQRGRELPGQQQQRRVPRHDRGHHADRLAGACRRSSWAGPTAGSRRRSCPPSPRSSGTTRGDSRIWPVISRSSLPVVARLELGQALGVALDQVGEPVHQLRALEAGERTPLALERRARGGDGAVDVLLVGVGHAGPGLSRVRVDGVVEAAAGGRDRAAGDGEVVVRKLDGRHRASPG